MSTASRLGCVAGDEACTSDPRLWPASGIERSNWHGPSCHSVDMYVSAMSVFTEAKMTLHDVHALIMRVECLAGQCQTVGHTVRRVVSRLGLG